MQIKTSTKLILSFQHVLAMFGATVLVPMITGLSIPVALFFAGLGTLVFHFVTKRQVPVFLGSSFAFIGGILTVKDSMGLEYATGAIMIAGLVHVIAGFIVLLIGAKNFIKLFPPVVVAPIIMVIGLILAPVAVDMASKNWLLAIITMATVVMVDVYAKGIFKIIPIISGVIVGYLSSILLGQVDLKPILEAKLIAIPQFIAPQFDWVAISIIAPIALVTIIEHIGDVTTNGSVVGRDFIKNPGLHRTLIGDGLAAMFAGFGGGPATTTYAENTGTLAITRVYDPAILRMAAVVAMLLSFSGTFTAIISTIPVAVMGGISFVLFGMIANIGVKQLVDNQIDLGNMRNAIVFFAPLILGITSLKTENPAVIHITETIAVSGLSLSALVAISLNLVFSAIPCSPKFFNNESQS